MASGLGHTIDWGVGWLQPWCAVGRPLESALGAGSQALCAALNPAAQQRNTPVRFVPQEQLPPGQAYEDFVARHAAVPTRDGLHDFFNALCWLQFPKTKVRLNRVHAAVLKRDGVRAVRGPVRDAATVFDENGAVFMGPPDLWQALQARRWPHLFGPLRPLWGQARVLLFGHALLEKLVHPRKAVTAHVLAGPSTPMDCQALDDWLSGYVSADTLARKPFAPLPVLGVPGWHPDNADLNFYADTRVFRPAP